MKYRTLAEGTQIKAILDATEAAPALGKGQPVVVTKWPGDRVAFASDTDVSSGWFSIFARRVSV